MNKEFSRMQKLAGLLTENMGGTDLDSTASDVYDYFSKKSSSTSTDRRKYIKSLGLSDDDTETVMMKVTDMMSDNMNENMGGTDLESVANDVYNHFSKMSSSTSTDRRDYIKDIYSLSDEETEDIMMKVTDMMSDEGDMREGVASYEYEMGKKAGDKNNFRDPIELAKAVVGKHGQELKSSKDLSPREFESKALMYASKMMKEAGMEKVVMTNLFIDEDWPSDYISKVSELLRGMSGKEMGMEEGLNKLVREMKKEKNTDVLRKKIREMILAEMDGAAVIARDYDPVAEAKKDEEEVEDIDIDVTDEKMVGNDDPKVTKIQDLLNQLQDAAEELGDEKLLTQVGNTITFFTREHVANADNMG
jgi:hypothetical protein